MAQTLFYEGVLEELFAGHPELAKQRVRLTTLDAPKAPQNVATSSRIRFGMFPQLQALTEEDFQSAEWRGEEDSL